jgi:hypothetical protein
VFQIEFSETLPVDDVVEGEVHWLFFEIEHRTRCDDIAVACRAHPKGAGRRQEDTPLAAALPSHR